MALIMAPAYSFQKVNGTCACRMPNQITFFICCDADNGWVTSNKKYFVRFRIQVFRQDEATPLLDETLKLKDRPVLFHFRNIKGFAQLVPLYRTVSGPASVPVRVHDGARYIIDLLAAQYPQIQFTTPNNPRSVSPYATYHVGLYFGGDTNNLIGKQVNGVVDKLHRTLTEEHRVVTNN